MKSLAIGVEFSPSKKSKNKWEKTKKGKTKKKLWNIKITGIPCGYSFFMFFIATFASFGGKFPDSTVLFGFLLGEKKRGKKVYNRVWATILFFFSSQSPRILIISFFVCWASRIRDHLWSLLNSTPSHMKSLGFYSRFQLWGGGECDSNETTNQNESIS